MTGSITSYTPAIPIFTTMYRTALLLLLYTTALHAQPNIKVTRTDSRFNAALGKRAQEKYYKDKTLLYSIGYTSNSWQITDSVVYDMDGCYKLYVPDYYFGTRHIMSYKLRKTGCDITLTMSRVTTVPDMYQNTDEYASLISFLVAYAPGRWIDTGTYKYNQSAVPSILTQYGIPFNAKLYSFSCRLDVNRRLATHNLRYERYNVSRSFTYSGDTLKHVTTEVKGEDNDHTVVEEFIIEPLQQAKK
jgi:hypothetical protein